MLDNDLLDDVRRAAAQLINAEAETHTPESLREKLEREYGNVYDTQELQQEFQVIGFAAPFVSVVRKSDGVSGLMEFTHRPRYYYNFQE